MSALKRFRACTLLRVASTLPYSGGGFWLHIRSLQYASTHDLLLNTVFACDPS